MAAAPTDVECAQICFDYVDMPPENYRLGTSKVFDECQCKIDSFEFSKILHINTAYVVEFFTLQGMMMIVKYIFF